MQVVDLFCGAGGFSRGFADEGFVIKAGFDFNPAALQVYKLNFPGIPRQPIRLHPTAWKAARPVDPQHRKADLSDLIEWAPTIAELSPDVIIGGPPCQAFSKAGSRGGDNDQRAGMTVAFAILASIVRPRYVVMENVKEVRKSDAYRKAKLTLKKAGYGLTEVEILASDYGVAQNRVRGMLVGALGEADNWMQDFLASEPVQKTMTVADALGPDFGLPTADGKDRLYFRYPGGKSSPGTRSVNQPTPTITSKALDRPSAGYKARMRDVAGVSSLPIASFDQLSILAGFPQNWRWYPEGGQPPKKTEGALMLANAVAPPMASVVARCIQRHARGEEIVVEPKLPVDYQEWLRSDVRTEAGTQRLFNDTAKALGLLGSRSITTIPTAEKFLDCSKIYRSLAPEDKQGYILGLQGWFYYNNWDFPDDYLSLDERYQRDREEGNIGTPPPSSIFGEKKIALG